MPLIWQLPVPCFSTNCLSRLLKWLFKAVVSIKSHSLLFYVPLKVGRVSMLQDTSILKALLKLPNMLLLEYKNKLTFRHLCYYWRTKINNTSPLTNVSRSNYFKYSFSNLHDFNQINLFSKSILTLNCASVLTCFTSRSGRHMETFCTLRLRRASIALSALKVVKGKLDTKGKEIICILSWKEVKRTKKYFF